MARRLTNPTSGLGLAALMALALACAYEVGSEIVAPLAAAEQGLARDPPPEPMARLIADPARFEPAALFTQPVFAMNRMPPQPLAPPPAPAPSPPPPVETVQVVPPDYILAGIMISGSEQRVLLKKHKTEKGQWIARGKTTSDGWTVLTVSPDKATMSQSASQFTLEFRSNGRNGPRG